MDALVATDRINAAIVASESLDDMLVRVLDELLGIFDCERAWVIYPCDPDADHVALVEERYRPGFEGAKAVTGKIPVDAIQHDFLALCEVSKTPVRFDPLCNPLDWNKSAASKRFSVYSQLVMQLRPANDLPWVFGIHHCREAKVYEGRTLDLFQAIANRIGDGLTTQLALQRLRDSEARYRALVDHAAEAIVVLDLDAGTFMEANPTAAKLYGYPIEELIGVRGPIDVSPQFQPDGQPSADKAMRFILQALDGELPKFDWHHRHADGREIPCEIALSRFPDPTRRLVRGSILNVSEKFEAERQKAELEARLMQGQKLESIGQLTGGVAHDFNNLLNVILGNLELLRDDIPQLELRELIDAGIGATMRGADLTRKMLSFARRSHLEPAVLDLNEMAQELDTWMRRTLPASIDVRLALADGLWPVEADRALTDSALLNLIINARDAMPNGGDLIIETANLTADKAAALKPGEDVKPGACVMLAVSDTGTGIDPDVLSRVFEPFYTTKPPDAGSGLGLSMVHGFLSQSGGSVRIYSESGVGTSVKLFFPSLGPEADDKTMDNVKHAGPAATPSRILLAEDQAQVGAILVRTLSAAGYQVVAASDGDKAAAKFYEDGPFDLLVTDVVMPGILQGPMLARTLRETHPDLPVIFMSGYPREATLHGNGLRAEDIRLMKPVTRAELLSAVSTALGAQG